MSRAAARIKAAFGIACLALLLTAGIWQFEAGGAGAASAAGLVVEPSLGSAAETFLGASPLEAAGEVWATASNTFQRGRLTRYTDAGGWEIVPPPLNAAGQPIEQTEIFFFNGNPDIGRTTPAGGVVVLGEAKDEEGELRQVLLVRDPGGEFREPPEPPSSVLEPTGTFLLPEVTALVAAQEATGAQTRAFVVRSRSGINAQAVLSYAGGNWSSEPVCAGFAPGPVCVEPSIEFRALEIEASGGEAWMLGEDAEAGEGIELFRREANGGPGGTAVWRQQALGPPGSLGALFAQPEPLGIPLAARSQGQPLTVSPAGVWVDASLDALGEKRDATFYYDIAQGQVTGSWCDAPAPPALCTNPLGAELQAGEGRSFAWPAAAAGEPFGQRVVTGVGQGAILNLNGSAYERIALAGGAAGGVQGAALSAPDQGWLGATPPLRLTRSPEASRLQPWPVPFRRPLTAVAAAPGASAAALSSEALAVGVGGQVARYRPGSGWQPEFLLSASGKRATPTLRGVAWPEPARAFAVGDEGAMWVWQRATGLWEPDPAAPPNLIFGNFTAIAFDPAKPQRGYAVGKQGLLLGYGRAWKQEALPPGIPADANFTSIAFAGKEALVTWRYPFREGTTIKSRGGVIVNDGSGWRVDEAATAALGELAIPTRVAGLPDGGAVVALSGGEKQVQAIEREGAGAAWQPTPGGQVGFPAAVAAFREDGRIRALLSVAAAGAQGEAGSGDEEQAEGAPGQPPVLADPYTLPGGGLLIRQTPSGWRDEQRQAFPLPAEAEAGQETFDLPMLPDPVLALLLSGDGQQGWAVGGETGTRVIAEREALQTAAVMRYGAAAAPPSNAAASPIAAEPGMATFAIGGNAGCAGPCADLAGTGIAPDRWLRDAVSGAAAIGGMRAFLYTGPGVAPGGNDIAQRLATKISAAAFGREELAYARRLVSPLPAFAAPAESDLDATGTLATFQSAFGGFGAPFGSGPAGPGIAPLSQAGPGKGYYSFASSGDGGTVRVIVLDYSLPSLSEGQGCWLAEQLSAAGAAGTPAIVVGSRDLGRQAPNAAADATKVVPILVTGAFPSGCAVTGAPAGASAYFYDFPEQNRSYSLIAGGRSIPAFGSGTLGYVAPPITAERDFVGDGGYLLASVNVAQRDPATNVAPVSAKLIPLLGGLAINATDGTLLRRSRPALFEALGRRPIAGTQCEGSGAPSLCQNARPDPYVEVPPQCRGAKCATGMFPDYRFTSSEPDIADFVSADPSSPNPRSVLLVNEKPVLDSHSGLLCAFNAGTTTVTVATGGLTYSQQVTVLAGSVQRPCGTTPLRNRTTTAAEADPVAPPPPAPAPAPAPAPSPAPPPPPPPPPPASQPPAPVPPAPVPPPAVPKPVQPPAPVPEPIFLPPPPPPIAVVPIVPPPPAPALPPTPPSGTSPVSANEKEEEEEEAMESAHQAVAVRPFESQTTLVSHQLASGGGGPPRALVALMVLAAFGAVAGIGGAAGARRPRRRRSRRRLRTAQQSNHDFRRYR